MQTDQHSPFAPTEVGAQTLIGLSAWPLGPRFRGDERGRGFGKRKHLGAPAPTHRHRGNSFSALSRSILRKSESLKPNSPSPLLYSKPKRNGKSVPQRICEIGTILVSAASPGGCAICATS